MVKPVARALEKTVETLALDRLTQRGDWQDVAVITGLSVDSRETRPGHLFAAVPGTNVHGAEFADYARRMGAVAVLTDPEGADWIAANLPGFSLPLAIAPDARLALAETAARWFDAQPEVMVAVTGTNGKTSVASFVRQIWEANGITAVSFGTVGVEGAVTAKLSHTTPEPITLHRLLGQLSDQNVSHASMEASSHGLAQRRLDAVHLRAAAFTNISRDHLDYHADFEDYFQAKAGLFTRVLPRDGTAVIQIDDVNAGGMVSAVRERGQRLIRVGRGSAAEIRLTGQQFDQTGQNIRFTHDGVAHTARLDLIGAFQADNALMAAGLAIGCGMEPAHAFRALDGLQTVRGRMQLVARRANGGAVFVDYSHTSLALETALKHLREHVLGRIVVVFGAGGDRDQGKRPMMGQAAAEGADVVFVTDDNPRSEDPALIRAAVMASCPNANEIGDRAEAILAGVDALQPGDALLIAGKGHETGQIVGQDIFPFDDAEQASIAVAALDGLEV